MPFTIKHFSSFTKRNCVFKRNCTLTILLVLVFQSGGYNSAYAAPQPSKLAPMPSYALDLPVSTAAAMSASGAAAPGDASVIDVNPAVLPALKKQYTVFGDAAWGKFLDLWDAGIFDSVSSPVAAVLRVRQSVPNNTSRDVRATAGLGYQIPETNLNIGLSGNIELLDVEEYWSKYQATKYYFGTGLFYTYVLESGRPVNVGVSVNKLGGDIKPTTVDVGASTVIYDKYYTLTLDGLADTLTGFQSGILGLSVNMKEFFELKGSLGYNPKESRFFYAGGLFFNGPLLHLYYTIAKMDSDKLQIRHTAGTSLTFSF